MISTRNPRYGVVDGFLDEDSSEGHIQQFAAAGFDRPGEK